MSLRSAIRDAAGRLYAPFREHFHESRAELFVRLLQPAAGSTVLDLGGSDGSLTARIARRVPIEVTVADPEPTRYAAEKYGFKSVSIVPGEPLPFPDQAFDIVFSNSVIEHATTWGGGGGRSNSWLENARQAQRHFANEVRRVGKGYFVQTPHADFPIDAHLWLPFTNWFPHSAAKALVRVTDRLWIKRCGVADWALLRRQDMARFFPDGEILVERFLALPKSLIAFRRSEAS